MNSKNFVEPHGNGCKITIEASPGAQTTEVTGINPWRRALKIRIAAEPAEGRANKELVRFFADKLTLPTKSIRIIKGERSSLKVIELPIPAEKAERLLRGD